LGLTAASATTDSRVTEHVKAVVSDAHPPCRQRRAWATIDLRSTVAADGKSRRGDDANPAMSDHVPTLTNVNEGELVQTNQRQVDDQGAKSLPERAPPRPESSSRRPCCLSWGWRRRTHHLALPHLRHHGVQAATRSTLRRARRACGCADLHQGKLIAGRHAPPRAGSEPTAAAVAPSASPKCSSHY
jgi:hypothetical protein